MYKSRLIAKCEECGYSEDRTLYLKPITYHTLRSGGMIVWECPRCGMAHEL